MTINKSYLKSKTLWSALIIAILPLFPEVQVIIKDNPEIVTTSIGVVFAILRVLTNSKLE